MDIKCIVSCRDANGTPTLQPCIVCGITKAEYDDGKHYELAKAQIQESGYEDPGLVFDEHDGPAHLFKHYFERKTERNRYLTCIFRRAVSGRAYPDIVQDCVSFPNPDKDPRAIENTLDRAKGLAEQGYHGVEPVLVTGVGEILNNSYAGATVPPPDANQPSPADLLEMAPDLLLGHAGPIRSDVYDELRRRLERYGELLEQSAEEARKLKIEALGYLSATTVCKLYEGLGLGAFRTDAADKLGRILHELFLEMAAAPPVAPGGPVEAVETVFRIK